jgi:hypothetical protein
VLRRILQESDSLSRELSRALRLIADAQEAAVAPSPVTPAAAGTPAAQPENRDNREVRANRNLVEEVHRLRDELAKANQELDRVKKRLSEQRP